MGDINYIVIKVNSKLGLSDPNELKFQNERLSLIEYREKTNFFSIHNCNSDKLIKLFVDFEEGLFIPDRCNTSEPIRDKFISSEYKTQVRWLSQLGGAVFLKKVKGFKYECIIENMHPRMFWDRNGNMNIPVVSDPIHLCEVRMFLHPSSIKKIGKDMILKFYNQLVELLKSDNYSIEGLL